MSLQRRLASQSTLIFGARLALRTAKIDVSILQWFRNRRLAAVPAQ